MASESRLFYGERMKRGIFHRAKKRILRKVVGYRLKKALQRLYNLKSRRKSILLDIRKKRKSPEISAAYGELSKKFGLSEAQIAALLSVVEIIPRGHKREFRFSLSRLRKKSARVAISVFGFLSAKYGFPQENRNLLRDLGNRVINIFSLQGYGELRECDEQIAEQAERINRIKGRKG